MKDSDQGIDKVLAALRDAEPPKGMETRILDALQNHASNRPGWSWRMVPGWLTAIPSLPAVKPIGYMAALAGVVALVLAVPAIHRQRQAPARSAGSIPSGPVTPAPPVTLARSIESQKPATVVRSPRKMKPEKLEPVDSLESLAVREMNAPSHPAPPLPLTEQEKALVRFVRTRTTKELAAIDPVKWAAQDEQQRAKFDTFFRRYTKEQADKKKLAQEAMNKS